MNWTIILIVGILAIALLVFLIFRNQKDETDFEKKLNNDYTKPKDENDDIDIDEITKNVH